MMVMGCQPIASLVAGYLVPVVGAPLTVGLTGVCCLGVAVFVKLQLPVLERR